MRTHTTERSPRTRPSRLGVILAGAALSCGPGTMSTPDAAVVDVPVVMRTVPAFMRARIGSQGGQPNFQQVNADIDFGEGPFQGVKLVVDLDTSCFPFENWRTNPPPMGQNFPADCDAFDRNFEFTLDEPRSPSEPPAIELARSITPFGGPLHYEVDVTDVANGRPGAHRLRAFIASYSDGAGQVTGSNGGWWVSARFEVTQGPPPRRVLAVIPLVNTSAGHDARMPAAVPFEVPAGAVSSRVEYRVTGHGGGPVDSRNCIGPAEEFCERSHGVFVDEVNLSGELVPWRDNCAELCTWVERGSQGYCRENPTGLRRSVEAPRANWCPGSVTPPFVWEPTLAPGRHTFRYEVDAIAMGGSWRTSATVFVFGR